MHNMYNISKIMKSVLSALAAFMLVFGGVMTLSSTTADAGGFERWVKSFRKVALRNRIRGAVYDAAFAGVTLDRDVLKSARYQPEFVTPIWEYLAVRVSDSRIEKGRELLKTHKALFDRIEQRFGVSRYVVTAIWGLESNFGSHQGKINVISALATLAYAGGRYRRFGRSQLIAALKILQRGDITPDKFTGSWAGAMGQTQFIPTTYNAYAVDFDGDGKRNIWGSIPDALASTANYLRVSRWKAGQTWGYEVRLPKGFNIALSGKRRRAKVSTWMRRGIVRVNGRAFPRKNDIASLLLPAGANGPAFLILNNFRSILRYNNADSYALTVGHLADRLWGGQKFVTPWPIDNKPLTTAQRKELQQKLTDLGFDTGGVDGLLGRASREAIRRYQRKYKLKADGYAGTETLEHIRAAHVLKRSDDTNHAAVEPRRLR